MSEDASPLSSAPSDLEEHAGESPALAKRAAATNVAEAIEPPAKRPRRVTSVKETVEVEETVQLEEVAAGTKKRTVRAKKEVVVKESVEVEETKPAPKKRAPAKKKKTEDMGPLAQRATGLSKYLGAHISAAGGVQNSIVNSMNIGGNAFALFLKNQRKWVSPDLNEADVQAFRAKCVETSYDPSKHVLPHGSYLINLASPDEALREKSYTCFVDDLKRCNQLGITRYNFHPGSATGGSSKPEGCGRIAEALNKAHKEVPTVITVLENMCGTGNVIGATFGELREVIDQVDLKDRVGVCLDTCHLFASGHDIRTDEAYEDVMKRFGDEIGWNYLKGVHLNDSKADLGEKRDLHENIGQGYIGLEGFRLLVNDTRFDCVPMVLETPNEDNPQVWADEISMLTWLIGKKKDDPEVLAKAEELQAKGKKSREEQAVKATKKKEAAAKKAAGGGKGRKKKAETPSGSESE
ncbi:hypothetical protein G7K_5441-t1 [Saitoella complicata NRRL Y-17804]|uniref:Apurinic-apyrimidinic endonuclease 1 n=2 Tax=Saitoella complicata (strain BCRC 22490 / CBS 7301 / JCM 7358 / NBRC 10748 / NRRL Y-17804) TaxID=698492 RepID=A0A0E9NNB8_SAICN|nr:hypothetical protein G7K_5441-t1 [Saitoella complicata NRRL Y-17804]